MCVGVASERKHLSIYAVVMRGQSFGRTRTHFSQRLWFNR